jgi:hypothetical protein
MREAPQRYRGFFLIYAARCMAFKLVPNLAGGYLSDSGGAQLSIIMVRRSNWVRFLILGSLD